MVDEWMERDGATEVKETYTGKYGGERSHGIMSGKSLQENGERAFGLANAATSLVFVSRL